MNTRAGVGISHHRHWKKAAGEATEQALEGAGTRKPDLVLMFASTAYPQKPLLEAVRNATGGAPLAGGTGCGLIGQSVTDEGNFYLGVMALKSDEIRFDIAHATGLKERSEEAGAAMSSAFKSKLGDDALAMITLADGLTWNFDRFKKGLDEGLGQPDRVPMFGGATGDNFNMKQTYQYHDDEILSDGAVCVLFSGAAKLAWSINHGCVTIGDERKITKADGNVICELDGKPALEVLKEYLDASEIENWTETIVNLCIGFKASEEMKEYDEYIIRFMPSKDDETGSFSIPSEVSAGTSIWMTRRDKKKISDGVRRIADDIVGQLAGDRPKLVLHFDCGGRGKLVFRDQEKKDLLEELQRRVGADIPWLGFYTLGEIGPVAETNHFHNYTLVLLALH